MKKLRIFSAVWCGPCKAYHPIVDEWVKSHPEVEIEHIDVDSDETAELIKELEIRSVPTTMYYKDNKLVKRVFGLLTKEKLTELIEE